ncbi:hypothetical protein SB759_36995, partial [Pseudomonas sp. SIMBA_059]
GNAVDGLGSQLGFRHDVPEIGILEISVDSDAFLIVLVFYNSGVLNIYHFDLQLRSGSVSYEPRRIRAGVARFSSQAEGGINAPT